MLVCLVGHFGLYIRFDFLDFGNGPCHSRAWKDLSDGRPLVARFRSEQANRQSFIPWISAVAQPSSLSFVAVVLPQALIGTSPPVASALPASAAAPCKRDSKRSRGKKGVLPSTVTALHRGAGGGHTGLDSRSNHRRSSSSPSPTRSSPSLTSPAGSPSRGSGYQRSRSVGKPRGVWRHLVAGGMAGAASRTATAPLETLRLRMMVASSQSVNLGQACKVGEDSSRS